MQYIIHIVFHITNISRKMDIITSNCPNFPLKHDQCHVSWGNLLISFKGKLEDLPMGFTYGSITYVMSCNHNMGGVSGSSNIH